MVRNGFYVSSVLVLGAVGVVAAFWRPVLWSLVLVGPLVLLGVYDVLQRKRSLLRTSDRRPIGCNGEIYHYLTPGVLVHGIAPAAYRADWQRATASSF